MLVAEEQPAFDLETEFFFENSHPRVWMVGALAIVFVT